MSGKAESRQIYSNISLSENVAALGAKGALLFTWLIPHCDSQGRMEGKPLKVKHQVVPLLEDISIDDVKSALESMEEKGLIIWYEDGKERQLIQLTGWWEWQNKLKWKSPSHYAPPKDWVDQLTARDERGQFAKLEPEEMLAS